MRGQSHPVLRGGCALLVACLAACASNAERWAELHVPDVRYSNLHQTVADLLDAEGFKVRTVDPAQGKVESEWLYGTSQRELRGPSRRKAIVFVEASPRGGYSVRVRVAEEVIRKGGLLATRVRESDDWEPFRDNFEDAEYLMAKLRALLRASSGEGSP